MTLRFIAIILMVLCLHGCVTKGTSLKAPVNQTYMISDILESCDHRNYSDEGCSEFRRTNVTLNGILYFPNTDTYQPLLFPLGTKMPKHDNDDIWLDETLVDSLDMKLAKRTKKHKALIQEYHLKTVVVEGLTNTECVTANAFSHYNEDTGELFMPAGYCHTQADVYLSDYKITEIKK